MNIPSKRQDARRPQPHPALPGRFSLTEGDLITGASNRSAIGTLLERTTRYVVLVHLREIHTAAATGAGVSAAMAHLPRDLRRSLTWDQGKEMAYHAQVTAATGMPIYFCDPHSPWQRGSNENANGLIRQYLPKRTDLRPHTQEDLDAIAAELNGRPRQTLGFMTPSQKFAEAVALTP